VYIIRTIDAWTCTGGLSLPVPMVGVDARLVIGTRWHELYAVDPDEVDLLEHDLQEAPDGLAVPVRASLSFPPAHVRARWDVEHGAPEARETTGDFVERARIAYERRLAGQPHDRAVLVRSRITEEGYRDAGEHVWVLGFAASEHEPAGDQRPQLAIGRHPRSRVHWVTWDLHCFADPADTFELTEAHRARLRRPLPDDAPGG